MILSFLEAFTEYIGIILCIHKVSNKQIRINKKSLFDIICYMILMFSVGNVDFGKIMIYAYLFIYIKIRIADSWKKTLKPFAIVMCAIPMLQLMIYAAISEVIPDAFNVYLVGIIINIFIIIVFLIWKEKYIVALINIVTEFGKVIFFLLLIFLFRSLVAYYSTYKIVNSYSMLQIVICFLIVSLMLILWINSENEKKHKEEELRSYQLYTKTFNDAIEAIRMRQHEFDNHINAIRCMQYTIHDTKELIDEQNKYCNKILNENKYNKLLKLKLSPILVGYLYSKFTAATTQGMNIEYEIQDISLEHIAINDLIEIIGIFLDNAVDALLEQRDKELEIRLLKIDDKVVLQVANVSGWRTNSEIERFFEYGYSTKGKGHGIGLFRASTLLKKYKACIQVENITKNDMNYLCFKVIF